jgi:hypothetical protein
LGLRDPDPLSEAVFRILDPGSGIGFFRIPDLGSQIPNPYFESLVTFFGEKGLLFFENWPKFFSSAFKKYNYFQFFEICGYKKGTGMTTNFFFTPLFCCCFWIRDTLVRGTDLDPSIIKQKNKKNLDFYGL